jgi:hypothetical protein
VRYVHLLVGLILALCSTAGAQSVGQFYLDKQVFARGEPVFLYFRISSHSPLASSLQSGFGDQPWCSGIAIKASTDPLFQTAACPMSPEDICVMNGQADDSRAIQPERTIVKRFLLNFRHKIDVPGSYWVNAERKERLGEALVSSHARLYFRVDGKAPAYSAGRLQSWVDQLKSPDAELRLEAARVLASVGPLQMESTFIEFSHSPEFAPYAPLAFHRLRTQRSLIELANMVRNRPPGSLENTEAARYLAEDGGKRWLPVILAAAEQHFGYLPYAAEAGGDDVIQTLRSLASRSDRHLEAVQALGWAGCRQAVPILLEQYEQDLDTSSRADYALRMLTHRIPSAEASDQRYQQWSEWWRRDGANAAIFKPNDCGREQPLRFNSN